MDPAFDAGRPAFAEAKPLRLRAGGRRARVSVLAMGALALATLLAVPARAPASGPASYAADLTAGVAEALDGDTLRLADGREVRLSGIQAPKPPLRSAGRPWPIAEHARRALDELARGQVLAFALAPIPADRHRRLAAQATREDGVWLQQALLARGLARVDTANDDRFAAELLAAERPAREARLGLWALGAYRVLAPHEAIRFLDSFQIVEGRVAGAGVVRGRTELRLVARDGDHAAGLALAYAPGQRRVFAAAGLDPARLSGQTLRVRGWIRSFDGAVIDVTHAAQIEVLK